MPTLPRFAEKKNAFFCKKDFAINKNLCYNKPMSKKQKINKPRVVVTCKMGTIRMKSKKDYNRKKDKINLKKSLY